MNFLNYSLTALVTFLGLIIGMIIIKLASEEQKPGLKYFNLAKKITLFLTIVLLLYFFKPNFTIILIIIAYLALHYIKTKHNINESYYAYPLLGVIFKLTSSNPEIFAIEATLIFLYGIINGAFLLKKNNYLEITLKHISFLVISLILFFV